MNEKAWRYHPALRGCFHPEHPDDVQVLAHEGGPRFTKNPPELVWVRVGAIVHCEGGAEFFRGTLLNQPKNLRNLNQGDSVQFIPGSGCPHPVMVTTSYLTERGNWMIQPCDKCGCAELFDAPSDLIRLVFPDRPTGTSPKAFTSFCPLCGGVQVVAATDFVLPDSSSPSRVSPGKKWWQFWR
jgi:hypothetical protein